jgi:hypothetical protein
LDQDRQLDPLSQKPVAPWELIVSPLSVSLVTFALALLVRPDRAQPNPIVMVTFFVGALSVVSAIFLILEMGQPFAGLMQISSASPRHALAPISQ